MKTIYKYELKITAHQQLRYSGYFKPLAAGCQRGKLVLWAEVDPDAGGPEFVHDFYIYGTGTPLGNSPQQMGTYLSTVQMPDGLVWHVYDGHGMSVGWATKNR